MFTGFVFGGQYKPNYKEVVQRIYQRYVDGASLGGIAAELEANQVVAPSGNIKWSRSIIDKIISNGKYVRYAIPMEQNVVATTEGSQGQMVKECGGVLTVWKMANGQFVNILPLLAI